MAAMAAAVKPAASVEAAIAVESTSAMKLRGATAVKPTAYRSTSEGLESGTPVNSRVTPSRAAPVSGTSVEAAVIPRTSSDEESTVKPARPVISVRRARVWSIRIVAVLTNRRSVHISRPNADSDSHSNRGVCSLRKRQRYHQHGQHRQIF